MWSLPLALAAAASLLTAPESTDRHRDVPLTHRLSIVFVDVEGLLPPMAQASLRSETTRTLRAAGIALDWQRGQAGDVFEADAFKLLLLRRAPGGLSQNCAMGSVIGGEGAPRAAWLYLEEVLATLRLRREAEALPLTQARDVGLALGKVAAHELIHGLLPDLPHASSGLMAASMGRRMLLAESLPIDSITRAALAPNAPLALGGALVAPSAPF